MSGSGPAVARARRRRRITATTIADTTIKRIAAPDANKTVWYSSTRSGSWETTCKRAGPALNRLSEPGVPGRHSLSRGQAPRLATDPLLQQES